MTMTDVDCLLPLRWLKRGSHCGGFPFLRIWSLRMSARFVSFSFGKYEQDNVQCDQIRHISRICLVNDWKIKHKDGIFVLSNVDNVALKFMNWEPWATLIRNKTTYDDYLGSGMTTSASTTFAYHLFQSRQVKRFCRCKVMSVKFLFYCTFLNGKQRLRLKSNVSDDRMWICGPVFFWSCGRWRSWLSRWKCCLVSTL